VRLSKCDLYRLALTVILVAGFRLQCSGVSQNLLKPETHKWLNSLQAWYADAKQADWKGPADIKNYYRNASFLSNNRIVFNIKGNKYRLVVAINYNISIVYIRFVGTHQEYDKIDAATI